MPVDTYDVVIEGRRTNDGYPDEWVFLAYRDDGDGKGERRALQIVKRLQTDQPEWVARVRHVRYLNPSQATLDALQEP